MIFSAALTSCDSDDETKAKEFTVTFESNGGSNVEAQTVKEGEKITKPENPTRSGHEFDAWYREAGLTTEWKFDTDVVTTNITLYAKWTEDEPIQSPAEKQKEEVLAALGENSDLSDFAEALEELDFFDVDAAELTIFAVENGGMTQSAVKSTDDDFNIKRHVVKGKHAKSSLTDGQQLTALDGSTLTIKIEGGKVYVNGVELGEAITAGNSIVFIVDKAIPTTDPGNGGDAVQLLETITNESGDYDKYEYDEQNRINKISSYYMGELRTTETLTYSGNDLVKTVKVWHDDMGGEEIYEFAKSGDIITITGAYEYTLTLGKDGLPATMESESTWEDEKTGASGFGSTFTNYQFQNGNLISVSSTDTQDGKEGTITTEYSSSLKYDTNKSPFYNCQTPKWFILFRLGEDLASRNNVIEITRTVSDSSTGNTSEETFEYEYEYDSAGFLSKYTYTYEKDGGVGVNVIEYTYIMK